MRNLIRWTLVPAALLAVSACSKDTARPTTAMSDDLKRDLKLASQTQSMQINPDEVSPQSRQELALKPKKALNGPKVIRSQHPTVKASARVVEAAQIPTEVPQVQVLASAPTPSETPSSDAPPMARPTAIPAPSYPGAERMPAGGGGGGGILAGILGAVIRGGVVDDDHCDPRGAPGRRGGGRPIGGDIYRGGMSYPGGIGGGGGGGMGGGRRWP